MQLPHHICISGGLDSLVGAMRRDRELCGLARPIVDGLLDVSRSLPKALIVQVASYFKSKQVITHYSDLLTPVSTQPVSGESSYK